MKRILLILLAAALFLPQAKAIPAQGNTAKVKQPDGTYLTIRLVGDEFLHFNVTEDGYTVVRDERGFYVYAQQADDGELVATAQVAHDADRRQTAEKAFLARTPKFLNPKMQEQVVAQKAEEYKLRQKASAKHRAPKYDYTKFRGLVVLVEFNDQEFDQEDYKEVITEMINKENYTGYYNYNNARVNCTGSVVDYYRDNSMGVFTPQFDVVGPVKIDRSKYYSQGSSKTVQLTVDACNAIDAEVNFANYDGDKDGNVDMIYFIFAGHGAHVTGNDARLVWPHAYYIYNPSTGYKVRKDGVYLNRYACSTELSGSENSRNIDGIGTICHEFSHVLGLPDFYDTDYAKSGGQSNHPASWSLMAGGGYLNSSRTPAGYSLFERYMVGWAMPEVIKEEGEYSIERLNESNTGYRINTPVSKEYFILENRQKTRWDAYLPGHGLLVFRVDSTNTSVWSNNTLNVNPSHNYYELVRARGTGATAANDPFPGTGRVTTLNNVTTPASLKTWAGKETQFGLLNIAEKNGVITFNIENTYVLRELNLPETFSVGLGLSEKLAVEAVPEYAGYTLSWSSEDEGIATVDEEGVIQGISVGETTITVESDNGLKATCKVSVVKLPETNEIATAKTFGEGEDAILRLENAQVLYVYKDEIYVRDNSGAIVLTKSGLSVNQNDIVSGTFMGKLQRVNDMPQFAFTKLLSEVTVTTGEAALPHKVKVDDLSEAYYADLIEVEAAELVRAVYVYTMDSNGEQTARLFNYFGLKGLSLPSEISNKHFNILAIYGTHPTGSKVITQYYLLQSPEEVTIPSGIENVTTESATTSGSERIFDLQGRAVNESQLKKGIYIVGGRKVVVP